VILAVDILGDFWWCWVPGDGESRDCVVADSHFFEVIWLFALRGGDVCLLAGSFLWLTCICDFWFLIGKQEYIVLWKEL